MTQASALEVLAALTLAGLLGMAGQIVRAVGGLKKMSDEARAQGLHTFDLFVTSRLVTSLIVGFVAGMAAAVSMGLSNLMPVRLDNTQLLVGLAAAGYAGTDFLEAFARNLASRAGASGLINVQITKAAPAVIISPPNPSASVETNPIGVDKPAAVAKKNSARRKAAGSGRARKRS
jgi:hypothetical protein